MSDVLSSVSLIAMLKLASYSYDSLYIEDCFIPVHCVVHYFMWLLVEVVSKQDFSKVLSFHAFWLVINENVLHFIIVTEDVSFVECVDFHHLIELEAIVQQPVFSKLESIRAAVAAECELASFAAKISHQLK